MYDLLAPVYGWFTEGFDTADLKDAKALLVALVYVEHEYGRCCGALHLMAFVAEWNEHVHPFQWSTKSVAKVMAKCDITLPRAA